jgi:glycosyltransferase involved in cell wall biosynthesis
VKILWLSPFLLHPTQRGGQIRSLGILSELHRRHDIQFTTFQLPEQEDGVARLGEYSSSASCIKHTLPERGSLPFTRQLFANFGSSLPLTISRDLSIPMRDLVDQQMEKGCYEVTVCDFLSMAVNVRRRERTVLFQHNVETVIWRRLAEQAETAWQRWYFLRQAARMFAFEKECCRRALHVIAVSDRDALAMRELFGIEHVTPIPTGVDTTYFRAPAAAPSVADLVFTGSLDWIPNIDGLKWFVAEVLPLMRARRPACSLAIAGRNPDSAIWALSKADSRITIHANVPDIRPYLWGSRVVIVPLRVGGGTRLKIYEAMAAGVPQVSTTLGAEGLHAEHGINIEIADTATDCAEACIALLENHVRIRAIADSACRMVNERFGWQQVAAKFERILDQVASPQAI